MASDGESAMEESRYANPNPYHGAGPSWGWAIAGAGPSMGWAVITGLGRLL